MTIQRPPRLTFKIIEAWDQHLEVSRPLTKKSRPGIVDEINLKKIRVFLAKDHVFNGLWNCRIIYIYTHIISYIYIYILCMYISMYVPYIKKSTTQLAEMTESDLHRILPAIWVNDFEARGFEHYQKMTFEACPFTKFMIYTLED